LEDGGSQSVTLAFTQIIEPEQTTTAHGAVSFAVASIIAAYSARLLVVGAGMYPEMHNVFFG